MPVVEKDSASNSFTKNKLVFYITLKNALYRFFAIPDIKHINKLFVFIPKPIRELKSYGI